MDVADSSKSAKHDEQSHWSLLAQKYWRNSVKTRKVKNEVIKNELWDVLEQESFECGSLVILESLQLLEK